MEVHSVRGETVKLCGSERNVCATVDSLLSCLQEILGANCTDRLYSPETGVIILDSDIRAMRGAFSSLAECSEWFVKTQTDGL